MSIVLGVGAGAVGLLPIVLGAGCAAGGDSLQGFSSGGSDAGTRARPDAGSTAPRGPSDASVSDPGSGDPSTPSDPPPADPSTPSDPDAGSPAATCDSCQSTALASGGACATEAAACTTACQTLIKCVNACASGDSACTSACASKAGTTALGQLNAIADCVCKTGCATECATECGGSPAPAPAPAPTSCTQTNGGIGCCSTDGTINYYCTTTSTVGNETCPSGTVCGWDALNGWYGCVASGGSDPSGKYPKACGGSTTPAPAPTDAGSTPTTDSGSCGSALSFKTNVAPIFATACNGCHSNALNTASGAYSFLTTQSSGCGKLVVAGSTSASSLPKLLSGSTCGTRMPKGGPYLTAAQLTTVSNWICQGAKNN